MQNYKLSRISAGKMVLEADPAIIEGLVREAPGRGLVVNCDNKNTDDELLTFLRHREQQEEEQQRQADAEADNILPNPSVNWDKIASPRLPPGRQIVDPPRFWQFAPVFNTDEPPAPVGVLDKFSASELRAYEQAVLQARLRGEIPPTQEEWWQTHNPARQATAGTPAANRHDDSANILALPLGRDEIINQASPALVEQAKREGRDLVCNRWVPPPPLPPIVLEWTPESENILPVFNTKWEELASPSLRRR